MTILDLPLRIGTTSMGDPMQLIVGRGHLLGVGTTGAGKSSIARAVIVPAALTDLIQVVGIDLKGGVELGRFEPSLASLAISGPDALADLRLVREIIDARFDTLRRLGRDRWPATPRHPLLLLVVDELAELASVDRRALEILDGIGRLGRAAGVCIVALTQRAEASIIGGQLRSLFAWRVVMASLDDPSYQMGLGVDDLRKLQPLLAQLSVASPGKCVALDPAWTEIRLGRIAWWPQPQTDHAMSVGARNAVPLEHLHAITLYDLKARAA